MAKGQSVNPLNPEMATEAGPPSREANGSVKSMVRKCEILICDATRWSVAGDIDSTRSCINQIISIIGQPEFPTDLSDAIAGLCRSISRDAREAFVTSRIQQSTASLSTFISTNLHS